MPFSCFPPLAWIELAYPEIRACLQLTERQRHFGVPSATNHAAAQQDLRRRHTTQFVMGANSPNQILGDCYNEGISSRCNPALFTRDPVLGYVNNLSFGGRNAGFRDTEGFDFDVAYRLRDTAWGTFSGVWNTTYTTRDEFLTTNDPRATHPTQLVSFGSNFRIRSNLNLGWEMGAFGLTWMSRYYSAIKESCLSAAAFPDECSQPDYRAPNNFGVSIARPINRTGSNTFHDVQFRWTAPWNATVAVGANNVFERYGPVLYTQPSANVSYYGGFDIGRFLYFKYTQRF